jgi:outer membrane protein TolC
MIRRIFPLIVCVLSAAAAAAQEPVPLTQADAVARAIETSQRLAEAAARVAGAEAGVLGRRAAERPLVSLTGGYTRTSHVDEFGVPQPDGGVRIIYPDIPDNYFTRIGVQWPIYTAGRTDALIRAAEAEARASSADVQTARADLRLETIRAYWALVTAIEAERVLREAVARANAIVSEVRARFDAGLIAPNEVASAEAQRSRQQLQLIEAGNQRRSVLEELRRLTGLAGAIEPADRLEPAGAPPAAGGGVDKATGDGSARSERAALVQRIAAADARLDAVRAGRKPSVTASAAADYAHPNPRIFPRAERWRDFWEVSVTASWTLWDGGRNDAEGAEAAAAVAAGRARLAEVDSVIALDIAQRRLDLESARAALDAADAGVRSAAEARRVVAERFTVGVATSTDVIDAQVALLQAELDRTRSLAGIKLAEARLDRALGR